MQPTVSILIPCHNAGAWIAQAIESALAQTWSPKEIIVMDDGSTDESLKIIKRFSARIKWETGPNRGANYARNHLLALARGDWLQYLDADDYLLRDKISLQTNFLSACRDEPDVIFGPVVWEYEENRREVLEIPEPHDPWLLLASWQLPQTGGALWRKRAILDVGGWKRDQPCCQEHELYLRLIMGGKRFAYCPTGGAIYRQWSSDTVCHRDIGEVHRRRLEIEQDIENHLRATKKLTADRLLAVNQARFEIARGAWQYSPQFAHSIMKEVLEKDPTFQPMGQAAPFFYRWAFRLLGFEGTERVAAMKRALSTPGAPRVSQPMM